MIRMTLSALATGAIVLSSLALAPATLAQEADGYKKLIGVIASDEIANLVLETEMEIGFVAMLEQDPEVAANANECPGLISGMADAVMPAMRKSHALDYQWYRSGLERLFRRDFSEAEAADAANFFSTDLAQRFLMTAVRQSSSKNVIDEMIENDTNVLSEESYLADKQETVRRTLEALDPKDVAEFEFQLMIAPWAAKFAALRPEINALRLAMGNREFTPEHDAEFDEALETFLVAHYEACDAAEEGPASEPSPEE